MKFQTVTDWVLQENFEVLLHELGGLVGDDMWHPKVLEMLRTEMPNTDAGAAPPVTCGVWLEGERGFSADFALDPGTGELHVKLQRVPDEVVPEARLLLRLLRTYRMTFRAS